MGSDLSKNMRRGKKSRTPKYRSHVQFDFKSQNYHSDYSNPHLNRTPVTIETADSPEKEKAHTSPPHRQRHHSPPPPLPPPPPPLPDSDSSVYGYGPVRYRPPRELVVYNPNNIPQPPPPPQPRENQVSSSYHYDQVQDPPHYQQPKENQAPPAYNYYDQEPHQYYPQNPIPPNDYPYYQEPPYNNYQPPSSEWHDGDPYTNNNNAYNAQTWSGGGGEHSQHEQLSWSEDAVDKLSGGVNPYYYSRKY